MRYLIVALLLLTGCYAPLPRPTPEPDGHSDEAVIHEPREGVSVSVALPVGAWDWVATNLKGNTLTIRDAITIKDALGVAVTIAAGTSASIDVATDQALVTFSKPFPNAKRLGINADVKSLILKPDGTGTAQTAKFGAWSFRWLDDGSKSGAADVCACPCGRPGCKCAANASQAAASSPPKLVVNLYSSPLFGPGDCVWCERVKSEVAKAGDSVPFTLVPGNDLPEGVPETSPTMWWKAANGQIRYVNGYVPVDDLIARWQRSNAEAKK